MLLSCHGNLAVLDLKVLPFHVFQQFIDERVLGVGLLLGLGRNWFG